MRAISFEIDDDRCGGKPCLPGHRITINQIIAMVIEGMTRDDILDFWGRDYFDDLDLNDYIDFAQRVVADNGYCPGGLKFAKTWAQVSDEEEWKYVEGQLPLPKGKGLYLPTLPLTIHWNCFR
jgi:uncharacterized protein (DUF433 family)